jgi:hypothetical protein
MPPRSPLPVGEQITVKPDERETRAILVSIRPWQLLALFQRIRARQAFAVLGFEAWDEAIEIPEDAQVTGAAHDFNRDAFLMRVEHPSFPAVEPACELRCYSVWLQAHCLAPTEPVA